MLIYRGFYAVVIKLFLKTALKNQYGNQYYRNIEGEKNKSRLEIVSHQFGICLYILGLVIIYSRADSLVAGSEYS